MKSSQRDGNTRPSYLSPEKPAGQEATVRILYERLIGSGLRKEYDGCLLSPCLFNHAEHTMGNAGLVELQAGIKIGGRNILSLRYADDATNGRK